ncbi:pyridoxine/pyridoxamine 5'-phosphate oxidase [Bryobacterales bacterium F-183]|nr:pyridoxine/pyridoxamine 5'-phosphate oxidase [Bryobacterales bacterium F-183]
MEATFQQIREEYKQATLQLTDVDPDPIVQFGRWFDQAVASGLREPNAMTLATCSSDGEPTARIVLLKGFADSGFVFFTNYHSAKGQQLKENPKAALVFFWNELERQVRVLGKVKKVPREESEKYFATRPLLSQIGASVSPQSQVIPTREWLEQRFEQAKAEFTEQKPPVCPEIWGGYLVEPHSIEFWQGRRSRLHDRLQYTKENGAWRIERLAP